MKRGVVGICVLFVFAATVSARSAPDIVKKTHRIMQSVITGGAHCSATAIGHHALLTASHCELPSDTLYMDGSHEEMHIDRRIRDDADHTIYLISDTTFDDVATIDWTNLESGDDIYFVGNPHHYTSLFRRGLYSGTGTSEDGDKEMYFDVALSNGDSGAGIFNERGKIVAVISFMYVPEDMDGIKLAGAYPLTFTHAQIAEAVAYGSKGAVENWNIDPTSASELPPSLFQYHPKTK